MAIDTISVAPPVADRAVWQAARDEILQLEKDATHAADRAASARRALPMTPVQDYTFDGVDGPVRLSELFGGRSQLIVQNFMFDPDWDAGCPSCSNLADSVPHLAHFGPYDIAFARISRAPTEKLAAYNERMGWSAPWVSSYRNTYNRDWGWTDDDGEIPGVSVYLRCGDGVFLTYSTQGRGVEPLSGFAGYLDITPFGRQEDWEDSPVGWPQQPPFTRDRRHDEY